MRAWFIAALFALVLWQPAHAQQVLTEQEFGDAAVAMLRSAAPEAQLERRDALSITVRRPGHADTPEFTLNLDNAYVEYLRNPAEIEEVLNRFTRFAVGPRENAQMRERIVSVLRPRAMVDEFQAQMSALAEQEPDRPPSALVWRPFAGDLVEILAFDGAETIQYAMNHMLEEIGLSPDEAWSIAPGNLPARIGEMEAMGVQGASDLLFVTGVNGLAPSALAVPSFCSTSTAGTLVFLIVERNGYITADRTKTRAMTQLRALHDDLRTSSSSMSLTPIACQSGEMREFSFTD